MPNPVIKRFTVEGRGEFPCNLLRTDQCWPAGAEDAARLGAHFVTADPEGVRTRSVTLETAAKYSPNRQRWSSLGWRVVD